VKGEVHCCSWWARLADCTTTAPPSLFACMDPLMLNIRGHRLTKQSATSVTPRTPGGARSRPTLEGRGHPWTSERNSVADHLRAARLLTEVCSRYGIFRETGITGPTAA
jgi:hypothetical protein